MRRTAGESGVLIADFSMVGAAVFVSTFSGALLFFAGSDFAGADFESSIVATTSPIFTS